MNPTIQRHIMSGEILKEPIDITNQIEEEIPQDREWRKAWKDLAKAYSGVEVHATYTPKEEFEPTYIVMSSDDLEKTKKGEYTEGFREAVIRMKEVIPAHMIGLRWELQKLYLNTL